MNIKKGDLVIAPNLTFVASVNTIKYVGADPVLIDIDKKTGHLDLSLLEDFLSKKCFIKNNCYHSKSKKIMAVMSVHILGTPLINKLKEISKKYFLKIIEDAAEGMGKILW